MITSTQNPRIQWVRRLQGKSKYRQADNVFVIEGVRLIEEAQSANWGFRYIFFTETLGDRGQKLVDHFIGSGTKVERISANVMHAKITTGANDGTVMSAARLPVPSTIFRWLAIAAVPAMAITVSRIPGRAHSSRVDTASRLATAASSRERSG